MLGKLWQGHWLVKEAALAGEIGYLFRWIEKAVAGEIWSSPKSELGLQAQEHSMLEEQVKSPLWISNNDLRGFSFLEKLEMHQSWDAIQGFIIREQNSITVDRLERPKNLSCLRLEIYSR